MNETRRQKLEAMLAEDPNDSFLRYGLALELRKEGDLTGSIEMLTELTQLSPPYVPAFLMSAQQLAQLERIEDARSVLRVGIEEARQQGDAHAASEMAELLASLGSP